MKALWYWLYVYPVGFLLAGAGADYLAGGAGVGALIAAIGFYLVWSTIWGPKARRRRARRLAQARAIRAAQPVVVVSTQAQAPAPAPHL